jgi:hypothetical protein
MIAQTLFLGSARGAIPVIVILGLALYMLPTIIGAVRKVVNVGSVFAINLLLGWTLIGWAIALAIAPHRNPPHLRADVDATANAQVRTGRWVASSPQSSPSENPNTSPPAGRLPGEHADRSDPSGQKSWDRQRWTATHSKPQLPGSEKNEN